MSVPFAIAIYVVIWWTVLFAILPIGVRTQGEDGAVVPGTPESAPTRPRLLRVVLLTTLVSASCSSACGRRSGTASSTSSAGSAADHALAISQWTLLRAQTKRARPMGLARLIADLFATPLALVVWRAEAEILPQTWAREAPAQRVGLVTIFIAGTLAKPRPSVTPWNQENAAAEYFFPQRRRAHSAHVEPWCPRAASPGGARRDCLGVGTGYYAQHRRPAPGSRGRRRPLPSRCAGVRHLPNN